MKRRLKINFNKHVVTVTKAKGLLIHHIHIPGSKMFNVKFINTNGIMAVTGDYGNWIFCREFHPTANGYVSDGYWIEKLNCNSYQEPLIYDPEATARDLKEMIRRGAKEYGWAGEKLREIKEYFQECLYCVDDYWSYVERARNIPSFADHESAFIERKRIQPQLKAVFDAFDEICRRLKKQENPKPKLLKTFDCRIVEWSDGHDMQENIVAETPGQARYRFFQQYNDVINGQYKDWFKHIKVRSLGAIKPEYFFMNPDRFDEMKTARSLPDIYMGQVVEVLGKKGTITGYVGHNLAVMFEGNTNPHSNCHPKSEVVYYDRNMKVVHDFRNPF